MPATLKRSNSYRDNSDDESTQTEQPLKRNRIIQDNEESEEEEEEMEDGDIQEDEESEEEPDLTSSRRKNRLRELNQINFENMRVMEAGTIARVEVVNFMCHKNLKIDFGPKINFVIGHNGSGKSAILTAITIALGANANSTNRGKNLASFIKEGTNAANIIIHLTNGGDAPYKPELYPDVIIIERRINRDGGSPYKLKNLSGHIVSTKKDDLVAILDHMNLMVNNPLTILTQDMARKFLSDSTPEEKYRLFMHGTQLTQLQNDFKGIRESLETSRTVLDRKKQGLPALQAKANEAQKRYEDIEKARQIEDKIDELNNELVWSQIIAKEKESARNKRDAEIVKIKLEQIREAYSIEKAKVDATVESITKVNEDLEDFKNSSNPDSEEKAKLLTEKADKELKLKSLRKDQVEINMKLKRIKEDKERHQANLKAETDKLESSSRIKRNEILEDISRYKQQMEEKVNKAKQFRIEQTEIEKEIRDEENRKQGILHEAAAVDRKKKEAVDLIKKLQDQRGNRMKAYGPRMPEVLDAIQKETRWEKRRPVGPFGATMQLLKPQFSDTLESVLNKQLNAFAVESFEDQKLLFRILTKFKMTYIPIIIAEYDMFDYSSGEPDEEYLTCLRAFKFNDEWVKRQLIISSKIERMLLMEDREKADRIMYKKPKNIDFCFTSNGYRIGGKAGMKTESVDPYRGAPRFQKDIESEIRKNQVYERELQEQHDKLNADARKVQDIVRDLQRRLKECKRMEYNAEREVRRIEQMINEKEDILKEDDPVDLTIFHDEIKECDEKMRKQAQQFQGLKLQERQIIDEIKGVVEQLKVFEAKDLERDKQIQEYRKNLDKLENIKRDLNSRLAELNQEKHTINVRYETKYQAYLESEKFVKEWTEAAQEDYPDRVETERTPREIEKDIAHHQKLAESMEQEMGISAEELQRQTYETLKQWNEADSVVKGMEKLSRSLKKMLAKRITKWEVFRQFISISATHYFSYYLHMRGDEGTLRFNHETKKLDIRVSTGDQYIKGSRQKDSRSLSGGEKSFSQISFLLSLWQSISSPVICLDEFDVFMDAINRKQTMKMIMNAASENSSQYILITPQDASNMEPGPYVTVHRLADPDRS